jgi:hypothetical protein
MTFVSDATTRMVGKGTLNINNGKTKTKKCLVC